MWRQSNEEFCIDCKRLTTKVILKLLIFEVMPCRRFLNRLLGMPVSRQALLFSYFACTLSAEIQSAKAEGRYFEGVSDLSGSNISRASEKPQVRKSVACALSPGHLHITVSAT